MFTLFVLRRGMILYNNKHLASVVHKVQKIANLIIFLYVLVNQTANVACILLIVCITVDQCLANRLF